MDCDDFARLAPVEWQQAIDQLSDSARHRLEADARARATYYTRIAVYVGDRALGRSHTDAVKAQNTAARHVRRALGFAYPDDPITF